MSASTTATPVEAATKANRPRSSGRRETDRGDERLAVGRIAPGPDPVEQLGNLDDAVFEAIAGRTAALDGLKTLWPEIKAKLGPTLVEESREQYVRYALRVWRESLSGDELRNPAAAVAVVDVMSLLFDE
jgi:hypothetical protein